MKHKLALGIRAIVFLLCSFALVLIAYRGLPFGLGPLASVIAPALSVGVPVTLLVMTGWLLRRENSSLAEFGLVPVGAASSRFMIGFFGGCLLVLTLAVIVRLALPMHWEFHSAASLGGILFSLFHHVVTNTCEELGFRGYGFDRLRRLIGLWPAQAVVAGVSAVFHVVCGWSWKIALVHTTAGSVLFALVFVRWRSIPAAIGVHVAWNWTRDLILSFPVSHGSLFAPIQNVPWSSSEWVAVQCILIGGTLAACAGLVIRLPQQRIADPLVGALSQARER